jgi:hypothetical protein
VAVLTADYESTAEIDASCCPQRIQSGFTFDEEIRVTNRSNPHFSAAFAAARIAGYMSGVGEFLGKALQGIYDAHMEKAQMRLAPITRAQDRARRS